ncbi:hypothetical protein [Arthrobacter sp. CJ23]|uniref:hypothetical protein n=1 Tax=Arthrobacter sp. CJ23 TaxID=2972479 RepID=UPI00215CE812|nr:hypothetical protein [Arthrobacter sp. CJ23]UVJ41406.1 hypothetical protein NVV90_09795 [Arthrobacter sp. CJ23]
MIHVWPYQDQAERTELRARAAQHPNRPPAPGGLVNRLMVERVIPFDIVEERAPGAIGPVFEIRLTTYFTVSELRAADEAWSTAIKERSQHGSLVRAGRMEFGQSNGIVQIWAHPNDEHRVREAAAAGAMPPIDGRVPTSTVVKRLAPSVFSPFQQVLRMIRGVPSARELEQTGGSHAATYAHGNDSELLVPAPGLEQCSANRP